MGCIPSSARLASLHLRHFRAAGHPLALAGLGAVRPVVVLAVVVPVVVVVVVRVLFDLGAVEDDAQDAGAGVGDSLEGVADGFAGDHLGAGDDDDAVREGGEDEGLGDGAHRRGVDDDPVVELPEAVDEAAPWCGR